MSVVEQVDETLVWLELLEETEMIQAVILAGLKKESLEILSAFSIARHHIRKLLVQSLICLLCMQGFRRLHFSSQPARIDPT